MPSLYITIGTFLTFSLMGSFAGKQESHCPCFNAKSLEAFTAENINEEVSCGKNSNESRIGIFKKKIQGEHSGFHAAYGFSVYSNGFDGKAGDCLMEGDMMMSVDKVEQVDACKQLIRDRCMDLGFIATQM